MSITPELGAQLGGWGIALVLLADRLFAQRATIKRFGARIQSLESWRQRHRRLHRARRRRQLPESSSQTTIG